MNHKTDRRVKYTKTALREALVTLMQDRHSGRLLYQPRLQHNLRNLQWLDPVSVQFNLSIHPAKALPVSVGSEPSPVSGSVHLFSF